MPKQGGQGKGKPKKCDRGMGKALVRQHVRGDMGSRGVKLGEEKNLKSVLDNSTLDDFVGTAVMGDGDVEVLRVHKNDSFLIQPTVHTNVQTMVLDQYDFEHLRIPRKPAWTREMTSEDIDRNERDAFLEWRREIATIETTRPNTRVTPFEKNIEVWRQLWRVIERCDIAIQIVDARNPLLYYSKDLLKYASEQDPVRPMMILVNKADFLTERQRIEWAKEFSRHNIKFAFYSAFNEQAAIDAKASHSLESELAELIVGVNVEEDESEEDADEDEEDEEDEKDHKEEEGEAISLEPNKSTPIEKIPEEENDEGIDYLINDLTLLWAQDKEEKEQQPDSQSSAQPHDSELETDAQAEAAQKDAKMRSRILSRAELIHLITQLPLSLGISPQVRHKGRVCVGLVGFPNVGKSSVINTVLGVSKSSHGIVRVAVGHTPGKTKHFQTVDVNESLMLCDCPGLVFPSFMSNTADMVCSGVLPINQMRDYEGPATVITCKVPRHLLEAAYGLNIERDLDVKDNRSRPPTSSEFLTAYCKLKSYITGHTGRWDEFRACKEVLRDFNDGKILYVAAPHGVITSTIGEIEAGEGVGGEGAAKKRKGISMQDWLADVESVMARNPKIAERLRAQKVKYALMREQQQQLKAAAAAAGGQMSGVDEGIAGGGGGGEQQFVFGDGKFDYDEDFDGEDEEFFEEGQMDEGVMHSTTLEEVTPGVVKREHKKIKQWGNKNRKLRNKNPYDDVHNLTIQSNDRTVLTGRMKKKFPDAVPAPNVARVELKPRPVTH